MGDNLDKESVFSYEAISRNTFLNEQITIIDITEIHIPKNTIMWVNALSEELNENN